MPLISILFGAILIAMGLEGYTNTLNLFQVKTLYAKTALIPAGFGAALILLGLIGMGAGMRKHAMHLAAMIALIGFAVGGYRGFPKLASALRGELDNPAAVKLQSLMAAVCGIFLALCVKSFIDARRRRMQANS